MHLLVSEQYIDSIMHGATIKVKEGILNVQLRIFLTCAEAGHDFACETLEKNGGLGTNL